MSQEAVQLKTMPEVVRYWQQCIAEADHTSIREAAWQMADVMGNERFDKWYRGDKADPMFVEALDLATDYEVPIERELPLEVGWARIKELVKALEKKYL